MKIVVSVNELSTETQAIIDNMRRSNAPVLVGDPNKPMAVLLSLEEYERLLRETQKAAASDTTQPIARPAAAPKPPAADTVSATQQPAAEAVPAASHGGIAQRAAAAIQANRSTPPEPNVVAQRQAAAQPDPAPAANRASALRGSRLTRPLPKPPRPLEPPRPRMQFSLAAIPGGWQTIALVAGMLALGVVGFALIVQAVGG